MISFKNLATIVFAAALFALSAHAKSASCTVDNSSGCPANTACVTVIAPTTRTSGAVFLPSEIGAYEISLDGKVVTTLNSSTAMAKYKYSVPTDTILSTASVWSALVIDTAGLRSSAFSCSQPIAVAGPKSPPGTPNIAVGTAP